MRYMQEKSEKKMTVLRPPQKIPATVSKMETVVNRGFRGVVTDWVVCTFDAELGFLIQIYPIMKILGRKSTKIFNFRP